MWLSLIEVLAGAGMIGLPVAKLPSLVGALIALVAMEGVVTVAALHDPLGAFVGVLVIAAAMSSWIWRHEQHTRR